MSALRPPSSSPSHQLHRWLEAELKEVCPPASLPSRAAASRSPASPAPRPQHRCPVPLPSHDRDCAPPPLLPSHGRACAPPICACSNAIPRPHQQRRRPRPPPSLVCACNVVAPHPHPHPQHRCLCPPLLQPDMDPSIQIPVMPRHRPTTHHRSSTSTPLGHAVGQLCPPFLSLPSIRHGQALAPARPLPSPGAGWTASSGSTAAGNGGLCLDQGQDGRQPRARPLPATAASASTQGRTGGGLRLDRGRQPRRRSVP